MKAFEFHYTTYNGDYTDVNVLLFLMLQEAIEVDGD